MILRNPKHIAPLQAVRAKRSGFTLLEILVVVAIIVMLAGVGGYYFVQQYENAKVSKARIECNTLSGLVETFYLNNNAYPASIDQLAAPPNGESPYCSIDQTRDPWGKPYMVEGPGRHNNMLKADVFTTTPNGVVVGNFRTQ